MRVWREASSASRASNVDSGRHVAGSKDEDSKKTPTWKGEEWDGSDPPEGRSCRRGANSRGTKPASTTRDDFKFFEGPPIPDPTPAAHRLFESAPFVEAMRRFQFRTGPVNFALVRVSLVPSMHGEQKTNPHKRLPTLLADLTCFLVP